MGVPAEQFLKDSTVEAAQIGIELTENLQQLVVSSDLLKDAEEAQTEGDDEVQEENIDGQKLLLQKLQEVILILCTLLISLR